MAGKAPNHRKAGRRQLNKPDTETQPAVEDDKAVASTTVERDKRREVRRAREIVVEGFRAGAAMANSQASASLVHDEGIVRRAKSSVDRKYSRRKRGSNAQ